MTSANDGAAAPRSRGGAPLVPDVDLLRALYQEDDGARQRRHVVDRGEELLDRLAGPRVALLAGRLSRPEIEALAAAVSRRHKECGDPAVVSILSDIELRAEVEIAKLRQDMRSE